MLWIFLLNLNNHLSTNPNIYFFVFARFIPHIYGSRRGTANHKNTQEKSLHEQAGVGW